jgi:hypothetical protein
MHLLHKGYMENYLCWYAYRTLFFHNESMVERVVGSTFSTSNMHGVANDSFTQIKLNVIFFPLFYC